jgi:hypothetical protein
MAGLTIITLPIEYGVDGFRILRHIPPLLSLEMVFLF